MSLAFPKAMIAVVFAVAIVITFTLVIAESDSDESIPKPLKSLTRMADNNFTNYSSFFNSSTDGPPQGSSGWFVGDQHVHTSYGKHVGEPFIDSLPKMVTGAKGVGLDWVIFTDHSFAVTASNFASGVSDCSTLSSLSFKCMYNQEMSVGKSNNSFPCALKNSHYLAYPYTKDDTGYINGRCGFGYCSCRDEQPVINEVNAAGGMGFLAHPFHSDSKTSFDWDNWGVTGYTGMEILSANDGRWEWDDTLSLKKWDELLQAETNPNNGFVVGIGNSDAHEDDELGHAFTYCYLGTLTTSNIRNALKTGRCVLSNGPFLEFTVEGSSAKIGEEASLVSGDNIINVAAKSTSEFGDLKRVEIYIDGGYIGYVGLSGLSDSARIKIPLTTSNKYIRLEIYTEKGYRALTNPIWLDVSNPSCQCTSWVQGSCGGGSCASNERLETRTCTPQACMSESRCVADPSCTSTGGNAKCVRSGYEYCWEWWAPENKPLDYCDVSLALNEYSNVNNIRWGQVNDNSDPYVIKEYKLGWDGFNGADDVYYGIDPESCKRGGCSGTTLALKGEMVVTRAPGIAHHKLILAYDDTPSYWCFGYFNEYSPNYGVNNPVYVLNCYDDGDCQTNERCDKSGGWQSWSCVQKRADGSPCTSALECLSGYCDNDGVGQPDDNWCFTPYNTYFDGQEKEYCEHSTRNGVSVECDEVKAGTGNCDSRCQYYSECGSVPFDGCSISKSTVFNKGTYIIPKGIQVLSSNIEIDCNGATLIGGNNRFVSGIRVDGKENVIIKNCNITDFGDAIVLKGSSNNKVINNNLNSNVWNAIVITENSHNNIFANNNASNNDYFSVVLMYNVKNNSIINNSVYSNVGEGIHLYYADENIITGNKVGNHSWRDLLLATSNNNLIYNNIFESSKDVYDDSNNLYNITKTPGTNIVGGPFLGGNFWSKYTGIDTNNDGIGDTKIPFNYGITNGGDYLPLINKTEPISCVVPTDDMNITQSVTFCKGNYNFPSGILVQGSNILIDCNFSTLNGQGYGMGIDIEKTKYATIKNCNVSGYDWGIHVGSSSNVTIMNNTANSNNAYGIYLYNSSHSKVINNTAKFSVRNDGIQLWVSDNNVLSNNIVNSNTGYGFLVQSSSNNTIINNIVNENQNGINIHWWDSKNNKIYNNTINLNKDIGISFTLSSNNTISGNNLTSNKYGIKISSSNADGNLIYNNYFDNTYNVYDYSDNFYNTTLTPGTNIIGGPNIGGNYYSDYNGVDKNNDGIGDTEVPYNKNIFNGGDYLPLTNVYVPPPKECGSVPTGGCFVTKSTKFNKGIYNLTKGIEINVSDIVLDCNGATLRGPNLDQDGPNNEKGNYSGIDFYSKNGINLINQNNVTIKNCHVSKFYTGFYSYNSNNSKILNCNISHNNNEGIYLWLSNNNSIYNNLLNNLENVYEFDGNNYWNTTKTPGTNIIGGPYLGGNFYSDYMGIDTNNDSIGDTELPYNKININGGDWLPLTNKQTYECGSVPFDSCIVKKSTTFNKGIYKIPNGITIEDSNVVLDCNGATLKGNIFNSEKGIKINNLHNVTVKNCIITDHEAGIYLYNSSNCNFINNTAYKNYYYGFYLNNISFSYLINNTIKSSYYYGMYLGGMSNTLINNTVSSNEDDGIVVYGSNNKLINNFAAKNNIGIEISLSNNTLTDNTVILNRDGISLTHYSTNNSIINNVANSNTVSGINIYGSANSVTGNILQSNRYGIYINSNSNNNIVYNNYFNSTNNVNGAGNNSYNTTKTSRTNIIGGPYIGGNFYSDYTGVDTNNDGIGDTELPYNKNIANGGDWLPLVKPLAGCTVPINGMNITDSTTFCPGTYNLSNGISITSPNLTLDCNHSTLKGQNLNGVAGIKLSNISSVQLKNCNVENYDYGIWVYKSSYTYITFNSAKNNKYGILVSPFSSYNTLHSNQVSHNTNGIGIYYSSDNTSVLFNNATSNKYGIRLYDSSNSLIIRNMVQLNEYGIHLEKNSNNNLFYDNYFNNTGNFYTTIPTSNKWNVTINPVKNIIGGPYIGGNFWAQPDGKGFSEDCTDTDRDGICDSSYNLAIGNVDMLPLTELTNECGSVPFDGCVVTKSTTFKKGTYSIPSGILIEASNIALDCAGAALIGQGSSRTNGINISSVSNVTIKNCNISKYHWDGILVYASSNNIITDNIISSNQAHGIGLYESANNTLVSNIVSSNQHGVNMFFSSNNEIYNNIITNNKRGILATLSSESNLIYNNHVNNTVNVADYGNNLYNTAKTPGKNILGGPFLGGNYWSDYQGFDLDGDGLGNTPYTKGIQNGGDFLPLTQQNPTLQLNQPPKIGSTVSFSLTDVTSPGKQYALAVSFGKKGFPVGSFTVPLDADTLMMTALFYPQSAGFQNSFGTLNSKGQSNITWNIPNVPSLKGYKIYAAAVVYDNQGLRAVTQAVPVAFVE